MCATGGPKLRGDVLILVSCMFVFILSCMAHAFYINAHPTSLTLFVVTAMYPLHFLASGVVQKWWKSRSRSRTRKPSTESADVPDVPRRITVFETKHIDMDQMDTNFHDEGSKDEHHSSYEYGESSSAVCGD
jgi:hypothetical protein